MKGNLYAMDIYWQGSYLDKLIRNGAIVNFNYIDATNINDCEKEIWGVPEIEAFMKRQYIPQEDIK